MGKSLCGLQVRVHNGGKPGLALQAASQAEAMGEWCLLACSPWLTRLVFLYNLGPPFQGVALPPLGQDLSLQSLTQKMMEAISLYQGDKEWPA